MKLTVRLVTFPSLGARDARRGWSGRDSWWLELTDARGLTGLGEATPLPGYSPDQLPDVKAALDAVAASDLEAALQHSPPWTALANIASLVPTSLPSARMALETAALDLLGQRQGLPAPVLLGAEPGARRPLAHLLGPASSPSLPEDAANAVKAGFTHLKLKLGAPGLLERELSGVRALRKQHGGEVKLRLDANGGLTAGQIEQAWPRLSELGIELFEEPGPVPERLLGALPLALDESLQGLTEADAAALLHTRQARFVVLKPMALGGLAHCWRLAERARSLGVKAVISHCFDGAFAFRASAALALALPPGCAQGLAPHVGLMAWSAASFPVQQGHLQSWNEPGLGAPVQTA
jgi:L-alanine-DL-glutamate epimerase-like enolase superfamily enzyme